MSAIPMVKLPAMVDDEEFVRVECPVCGQLLLRVARFGSIIEVQCWRNDCSKPLVRWPALNAVTVIPKTPKAAKIIPFPAAS